MACQECMKNGKRGWKAGANGNCYTGPGARVRCEAENARRMARVLRPFLYGGPGIDISEAAVDSGAIVFLGAQRGTVPTDNGTDSNQTLTIPTAAFGSLVSGDLLIAAMAIDANQGTITKPADFTLWSQLTNTTRVDYRICNGSEASSYTWTTSVSGVVLGGVMAAFRNARPGAWAHQYEPHNDSGPAVKSPSYAGAAYVLADMRNTGTPGTSLVANSPLTLDAQHFTATPGALTARHVGIAHVLNIASSSLVSGDIDISPAGEEQIDVRPFSTILHRLDQMPRTPPAFVAASKATTPADGGTDAGSNIVVPVPAGTQDGHHLFAVIVTASTSAPTAPAGWIRYIFNQNLTVFYRLASSEPASYTWTAPAANLGRGGVMMAISGGNVPPIPTDSTSVANYGSTLNPSSTSATVFSLLAGPVSGTLWIGFCTHIETTNEVSDFTATGGHTIRAQHQGAGASPRSCAISTYVASADEVVANMVFTDSETGGWRSGLIFVHPE